MNLNKYATACHADADCLLMTTASGEITFWMLISRLLVMLLCTPKKVNS